MVRQKRKKTSGPKDFAKKKQKVGKSSSYGNATNTSFKARQINVASQHLSTGPPNSAGADAGGTDALADIHARLMALLSKLSHHNVTARRESVVSLTALLQSYHQRVHDPSAALAQILLPLFSRLAPLLSDPEQSVRNAVKTLLAWLLPLVDDQHLRPYMPLLVVHACSAMTDLDLDVRAYSLQFVALFLDCCPNLVLEHGESLMENFLHLISAECRPAKTTGSSMSSGASAGSARLSLMVTPDSKLSSSSGRATVMSTLSRFLRVAFSASSPASADPMSDKPALDPLDSSCLKSGQVKAKLAHPNYRLDTSSKQTSQSPGLATSQSKLAAFFVQELLPLLSEAWVELSPSTFNLDVDAGLKAQNLASIADIWRLAVNRLHALESSASKTHCDTLWRSVSIDRASKQLLPYFPFGGTAQGSYRPNHQGFQSTFGLNLAIADILTSLVSSTECPPSDVMAKYTEPFVSAAAQFLIDAFELLSLNKETSAVVTSDDISTLLLLVKRVAYHPFVDLKGLVVAVNSFLAKLPANSGAFTCALRLFSELCRSLACDAKGDVSALQSFIAALPKYIWKLSSTLPLGDSVSREQQGQQQQANSSDVTATLDIAVGTLHVLAVSGKLDRKALLSLSPLFITRTKRVQLSGPFIRMDIGLQRRLMDTLAFPNQLPVTLVKDVCLAILQQPQSNPPLVGQLLVEALLSRIDEAAIEHFSSDAEALLSTISSLLIQCPIETLESSDNGITIEGGFPALGGHCAVACIRSGRVVESFQSSIGLKTRHDNQGSSADATPATSATSAPSEDAIDQVGRRLMATARLAQDSCNAILARESLGVGAAAAVVRNLLKRVSHAAKALPLLATGAVLTWIGEMMDGSLDADLISAFSRLWVGWLVLLASPPLNGFQAIASAMWTIVTKTAIKALNNRASARSIVTCIVQLVRDPNTQSDKAGFVVASLIRLLQSSHPGEVAPKAWKLELQQSLTALDLSQQSQLKSAVAALCAELSVP